MAVAVVALLLLGACGGGGGGSSSNAPGDPAPGADSSSLDGVDDGSGGADSGGGDSTTPPDDGEDTFAGGVLSKPVLIQEALPQGDAGVTRLASVATFGLPFAAGEVAADPVSGRPRLGVAGSGRFQFSTLSAWPDGSVKWALIDVLTDVAAGQATQHLVVDGAGVSDQDDLARIDGGLVRIDTGPLQATFATDDFDLFESVVVDGLTLVEPGPARGLTATGPSGNLLGPGADTVVGIERNGPALAVVRVDGTLVDAANAPVVPFTCRITARAMSRELEVTLTVRNATITKPEHVQLGSLGLAVDLAPGADPQVIASTHPGQANLQLSVGPQDEVSLYVAQTGASVKDISTSQYLPPIPRTADPDDGADVLEDRGYRLSVGGEVLHDLGDPSEYARHPFLQLSGEEGGVVVAVRDLQYLWPGSFHADGSGRVGVGVFPADNDDGYTFVFQQHESRTALFSFHRVAPTVPGNVALRLDTPLVGRFADYQDYIDSGAFAYDMVTTEQAEQALALMGLTYDIAPSNIKPTYTRYLYRRTTGGPNNHPLIETQLASQWLRHGLGGHYLEALDLALYKAEWQVRRSDDFIDDSHQDNEPIVADNEGSVAHTIDHFGDIEHRYREGIILAYHLTGDERFREAILDEAEILRGVWLSEQERGMYRSLVSLAHVIEFTGDTDLRDDTLIPRLEYFAGAGDVSVCQDPTGFGWEGPALAPGMIVPADRRYYAWHGDLKPEKTPTENYQTRGFITAAFGPLAFYHAARVLDPLDPGQAPAHELARGRLRDLAHFTENELFRHTPGEPDPDHWSLVYSYGLCEQFIKSMDSTPFHPILMGMAESYRDLASVDPVRAQEFLDAGVRQFVSAQLTGHLENFLYRLDCQHFLALYLEQNVP